jgi:hypothetical protein
MSSRKPTKGTMMSRRAFLHRSALLGGSLALLGPKAVYPRLELAFRQAGKGLAHRSGHQPIHTCRTASAGVPLFSLKPQVQDFGCVLLLIVTRVCVEAPIPA